MAPYFNGFNPDFRVFFNILGHSCDSPKCEEIFFFHIWGVGVPGIFLRIFTRNLRNNRV